MKRLPHLVILTDKWHQPWETVILSPCNWKRLGRIICNVELNKERFTSNTILRRISRSMHISVKVISQDKIIARLKSRDNLKGIRLGPNAWRSLLRICMKNVVHRMQHKTWTKRKSHLPSDVYCEDLINGMEKMAL